MIRSRRARLSTRGDKASCGSHSSSSTGTSSRRLPMVQIGDKQVGRLIFLGSDLGNGSSQPLGHAADGEALAAPRGAELLKPFRIVRGCGPVLLRGHGHLLCARGLVSILVMNFHVTTPVEVVLQRKATGREDCPASLPPIKVVVAGLDPASPWPANDDDSIRVVPARLATDCHHLQYDHKSPCMGS